MFSPEMESVEMSSDSSRTMLGLICKNGIVLANNAKYHRYYYVDENIYVCFLNAGHESEIFIDMFTKMDDYLRDKFNKMSVDKVRDVLDSKVKCMNSVELLLAGQDSSGLHLISIQSDTDYSDVKFIALGMRSVEITNFLKQKWQSNMNYKQGEQLAQEAFHLDLTTSSDTSNIEICIIFKETVMEDDDDEDYMDVVTENQMLSNAI